MKNLAGGARDERSYSRNTSSSMPLPCSRFSICILGSGFLWTGIGPGLPGPQGGYPGDNPGPGLPWLGNILSGIFGNPGYAPVYGGYPGYTTIRDRAGGIIIGGTIHIRHGSKVRHQIYRSMDPGTRLV